MTKPHPTVLTVAAAQKKFDTVIKEFHSLCEEGRTSPVSIDNFVTNRIKFNEAAEDLYTAMWYSIADTGVQVLRDSRKIQNIDTKPCKKK